ncbi:hypothetical protein KMT30_46885 [Streptomyces sp. IBSBF 2953]|jgi:hypothetical protein|uniref:DUF6338 family protein n=1 Tax=Pseudomonas TaxID=286 RepID=UPI0016561E03|nr:MULTISPECIES: DUF6338 family protein [Pseudomonas]MBC8784352.1 hypothetical protein [Pseudomonas fluorescens]MCQ9186439.1 hypothetical protein [Streptomyces hayashii]
MEDLATKIIPLVQTLVPGFLTTMIFYWLADVKKPGQFERTVQALISTGLITMLVSGIKPVLFYIGEHHFQLGQWTVQVEGVWGIGLATSLGLLLAFASNHDYLYRFGRWLTLTSRSSYPEWIYAFRKREGKSVVLTLLDGRRLFGYPAVWPTEPKDGHFLITQPSWMNEENEWVDTTGIESYLIANSDVYLVEFLE